MKRNPLALATVLLAVIASSPSLAAEEECRPCHARQADEFATSAMAAAATSADYRQAEADAADGRDCRNCHAPTGEQGVSCRDCHGGDPHAQPTVPTLALCGRCHDAPGETTVNAYAASTARRRGVDCRDCHSRRGRDHAFVGPSQSGFLDDVARLRLMVVAADAGEVLVVRISHRAGHRLPGGTTGRAVWLRLTGFDGDQRLTWREDRRFGWEQGAGRWRDHSLAADKPVIVHVENPRRDGSRRVEAELVYQFDAGPVDRVGTRQVVLDRAGASLW